jgi:hypothetical protein
VADYIPGIKSADQLETFIAKGGIKDPMLIADARAAYGSKIMTSPGEMLGIGTPSAVPVSTPMIGALPAAPPPVAPAPATPSPGLLPAAPKPGAPVTELAPQKFAAPAPPTHAVLPTHTAPVGLPLTQPKPIDKTTFGYTPSENALTQQSLGALDKQKGLAGEQTAIQGQQAEITAAGMDQAAKALGTQEEELQAKAAKRKAFLDKWNADTTKMIDEYSKAEVDPEHFWAKASTGQKIMNVVGMALGGAGAILGGGSDNPALRIIQQQIQQDIELQKASIAKKGAGIGARRSMFSDFLQQYGSEDAAEAATYEAGLRRVRANVEAQMAATSKDEVKLHGKAVLATIDDQMEKYKLGRAIGGEKAYDSFLRHQQELAAAQHAQAMKPYKDQYELSVSGVKSKQAEVGGVPMYLPPGTKLPNGMTVTNPYGMQVLGNANGQIIDYGTIAAKGQAEGAAPVATIQGFNEKGEPMYGQAIPLGKDSVKPFNEAQQAYVAIKQDLATIKKLRAAHGGGAIWSPEDTAEAKQAAARIQITLKSPALFQLGVIAGPDKGYLESQIPDDPLEVKAVGLVGSDPIGKKIESAETWLDNKYKNAEATWTKGGAAKNTALPLQKPTNP